VVNKPLIKSLQTNQYIISAQKILVGLIPYLKDQKSGQVANALAIDAKTLAPFLALLKQGLSDAVKVSGAPFSDLKDISFPTTEKSIYDEYNTNLAKQSGATGALIYGSQRPTATEITLSAQIDTMIATSIYPSLARWLSTYVNTLTTKYKFRFAFEGNKYTNDRKERLDTALKLADKGVVLPQKIAAAIGMDIFDLEAQLREGKAQNFYDLLICSRTRTPRLSAAMQADRRSLTRKRLTVRFQNLTATKSSERGIADGIDKRKHIA
jgi:hypothetical protein